MTQSIFRNLIGALFPYVISLGGVAFIGTILIMDLSQHTMIVLYAGLHGVGLGLIMVSLFMAMWIGSKP